MGFLLRRHDQHSKDELVRRHNTIDEITAVALEAHTAIGTERRAAAQQAHDTLEQAQKMIDAAGAHMSAERRQAAYYRVLAFQYEILALTNHWITRLSERARR